MMMIQKIINHKLKTQYELHKNLQAYIQNDKLKSNIQNKMFKKPKKLCKKENVWRGLAWLSSLTSTVDFLRYLEQLA